MEQLKIAQDDQEAWELQNKRMGVPHAVVDWKDTLASLTLNCECGTRSCITKEGIYYINCPDCRRVYACNWTLEIVELDKGAGERGITGIKH